MTDKQAQALADARMQHARVKVILAANYDNALIQVVGGFVDRLYTKVIARVERKHGLA
jgi:hypothetical protein